MVSNWIGLKVKYMHYIQYIGVYGVVVALIFMMDTYVRINQTSILIVIVVSCCVAASERIVHLRTPKETTVGKIMDSCIKMLGVTEDKSLFILKEKQGAQCTHSTSCSHYRKEKQACIHILYMWFDFKVHQRSCPQISRSGVYWHRHPRTDNWSCTCAKR